MPKGLQVFKQKPCKHAYASLSPRSRKQNSPQMKFQGLSIIFAADNLSITKEVFLVEKHMRFMH